MPAERHNQAMYRRGFRRFRRLVIAALPTVVWVSAIVAAVYLYQRTVAPGTVTGYAEDATVTLAHPEPGTVREVHVKLYDYVTRGQVLVSMDDREERILLASIEKDIERLRAEVTAEEARSRADNARAMADVEDLTRRFAIDREVAHIDYLSQLAQDAGDRILLRGLTVECEIVRDLYDQGTATFREYNDIQTQRDSLEATIAENVEVLAQKKKVFEESDRRWIQFVEHEAVVVSYEPVLTPLRLAIDVRERDLQEVVRRIDDHVLRSPVEGQVTGLPVHDGDRFQAGICLATVSPILTNRVVAYLPERTILSARVGAPVSVRCLAAGAGRQRQYTGTVISLSATVTESPLRYRPIPTYPFWGRGLVVSLDDQSPLIPGEAVAIAFLD
jgi:multidrug resistance efflux pump